MDRRSFFALFAGLPFVGRLAEAKPVKAPPVPHATSGLAVLTTGSGPRERIRITANGLMIFWDEDKPAGWIDYRLVYPGTVRAGDGTPIEAIYAEIERQRNEQQSTEVL